MAEYDPDLPKTDEELALEKIIRDLVERLQDVREDSAEQKMIERQLQGIRRGSPAGRPLDGGIRHGRHRSRSLLVAVYEVTTWCALGDKDVTQEAAHTIFLSVNHRVGPLGLSWV